jgi:hypothetical protein
MHTEGSNIIRNYSSLTISFSFIRAYSQTIRVYSRPKKTPVEIGSSAGVKILNRVTI